MHDPANHANPMEFYPDRFLGDHPESDPRETVFGYGRRICECFCFVIPQRRKILTPVVCAVRWTGPGLNLAQTSIWLACAMALSVFDIGKYVDGFGNVVEPKVHYTDGTIR